MLINNRFKDHIKTINTEIREKVGLTDIDNLPNEHIIEMINAIYSHGDLNSEENRYMDSLINSQILGEEGTNYNCQDIFTKENIKAICDTYIWQTGTGGLIARSGIADQINNKAIFQSNEEELFKPGKVVRVGSVRKLRTGGFLRNRDDNYIKSYMANHYKILGYNKDGFSIEDEKAENIVEIYRGTAPHLKVYIEDLYGNVYTIPQAMLVPTTIKDLAIFEKERTIGEIIAKLEDSAKYDITKLTDVYQASLRTFMDSSKLLQEKLSGDFIEEAERIYDIRMNMKSILEKDSQITKVVYNPGASLIVTTTPLMNSGLPIGKYEIILDLTRWAMRIINLDIGNTQEYQHPHVNRNGDPCLGERTNPLKESYKNSDYVTFIGGVISYLEDLYPGSVYVGMSERQSKRKNILKYQLEEKKPKEQPIIDTDTVEPTTADDLIEHEPLNNNQPENG